MLAPEGLEVELYFPHLAFYVARGGNRPGAYDATAGVVEPIEQDGDVRLLGDVVEATLPLGLKLTGALGGYAQAEGAVAAGLFSKLVGKTVVLRPMNGYPSDTAEKGAKWPEKPFLLHEEATAEALGSAEKQTKDEVPVTGVRGQSDNTLLRSRYGFFERKA